ncbi:UbiA family prenyltransferase [Pontibacter sp. G13]|uniref:UbiA family prenyltransferase n=1 Tax=Pontibacter sp. G13 TaxID=3074898 RepID=UPI00288A659E|nr:UbiA family prenyltransferase [Pontibacter sp. G13]WNJ17831.1 UbiA family prenyltransferase [Pontibacter sp. G13]
MPTTHTAVNPVRSGLAKRFWQYLKERFPIQNHGLLILVFTFSVISYSLRLRGETSFISTGAFLGAIASNLVLFFVLRVMDEFKDAETDAAFRSHLPVPRGLIRLKELAIIAVIVAILHFVGLLVWFPEMMGLYLVVVGYLFLMRYEFFVGEWLTRRPVIYAWSHMLIIPLVDVFAAGFDWRMSGEFPHPGLGIFFLVSLFNGMVLEIGRKIRIPQDEAEGVITYSAQYGHGKALGMWALMLLGTFCFACWAGLFVEFSWVWFALLTVCFGAALAVGFRFYQSPTSKGAKAIERVSGIWALGMYLLLGAGPQLMSLLA